jgi:chaperonin cofactor prefoldin
MKFFTLDANPDQILHKTLEELETLQKDTVTYKTGGLDVYSMEKDPIRLDFKFRGLSKI